MNSVKGKTKYEVLENSSLKCVLIGDTSSGKSSLAYRLASQTFKQDYSPTLFDNFAATVTVDGSPYHLSVFDTTGKHDMNRLRMLSYVKSDIILVCFSVVSPETFVNVEKRWVPELRHHLPKTPFLIVGTHIDVRLQMPDIQIMVDPPVPSERGSDLATRVGAFSYMECSSLNGYGVDELIKEIILAVQVKPQQTKKKKSCCVVL